MSDQIEDISFFGDESKEQASLKEELGIVAKPGDVSPMALFNLAKRILIWSACIFVLFALIRCFTCYNTEQVKEVWDYTKIVLNSIVSLVLGLYFGSSQKRNS